MHPIKKQRLKDLIRYSHWTFQQLALLSIALCSSLIAISGFAEAAINDQDILPQSCLALVIGILTIGWYIHRKNKAFKQYYRGED